jgi:hypothetical protein
MKENVCIATICGRVFVIHQWLLILIKIDPLSNIIGDVLLLPIINEKTKLINEKPISTGS